LWFAKTEIKRTGVAILVESAGNTWRLKEAGVNNVLGMYGVDLADEQKIILERLGIFTVVLALDAGKAGEESRVKLTESLRNFYKVVNLPVIYNDDIAELSIDKIKSDYVPILNKLIVKR
jgi:DNA primase